CARAAHLRRGEEGGVWSRSRAVTPEDGIPGEGSCRAIRGTSSSEKGGYRFCRLTKTSNEKRFARNGQREFAPAAAPTADAAPGITSKSTPAWARSSVSSSACADGSGSFALSRTT